MEAAISPAAKRRPTHIPACHKSQCLQTSAWPINALRQVCYKWLPLVQIINVALDQKDISKVF